MEKSLQTKESLKVRRSKRSPGVENTNDQVLIGFHSEMFFDKEKRTSVRFSWWKNSRTRRIPFLCFCVSPQGPHRGKRIDRIPYEDICKVDTWQQVPEPHLWSRKNGNVSAETWEKPHRIVNATLSYSTNISKEKCFSNPRENVCYSILQRASTKPLSHEAIFFFG